MNKNFERKSFGNTRGFSKRLLAMLILILILAILQPVFASTVDYSKNGNAFSSISGAYSTSTNCVAGGTCTWIVGNQSVLGTYNGSSYTGASATWNMGVTIPYSQIQSAQLIITWPSSYGKGLHSVTSNTTSTVQAGTSTIATPLTTTAISCKTGDRYSFPCYTFSTTYNVPVSAITSNTPITITVPTLTLWDIGTVTLRVNYCSTPGCANPIPVVKGAGDIDKDGVTDLVFQDSSGNTSLKFLNSNGTIKSTLSLGNTAYWRIKAVGSLLHDGTIDVFFQDTAGNIAYWVMGTNGVPTAWKSLPSSSFWQLKTIGGNSSTTNLIFQDPSKGTAAYWGMSASGTPATWAQIPNSSQTLWKIVASGDVTGDGIIDVFFQNTSDGSVAFWGMNANGNPATWNPIANSAQKVWSVVAAGDLTKDGIAEVFFQDASGNIAYWTMNSKGTPTAWSALAAN